MKMLEDLEEVVRLRDERIARAKIGDNAGWDEIFDECENAFDKFIATHHATIRDMAARLEAANALLLESDRYVFGNNHDLSVRIADHFNQAMQETGR